jgi:hypothetical protein
MTRLFALPTLAFLVLWLVPAEGGAFQRSKSETDDNVCLAWDGRSATMLTNERCSSDVPLVNDCFDTIRTSMLQWSPACSDFTFIDGGTTSRTDVGYDANNPGSNCNLIIFQETTWSGPGYESNAIALTTTTYDTETGEIVDADIEFNGVNFKFSVTTPPPANFTDVQNALVHELGHALGLDHSGNALAVMYPTAEPGETSKRTLTADDSEGVCTVYPDGQATPNCDGSTPDGGCKCGSSRGSALGSLLLLAALGLARRRRTAEGGLE